MFPKGLIVSSQALEGNPLRNSEYLAVMAEAAVKGGAKAIRANGITDITEIRKRVSVPIIGIDKRKDETGHTIITPDIDGVAGIIKAGADIIALEIIKPGLNHAGRGILGHIVNPAQTHFMFHLRRQL